MRKIAMGVLLAGLLLGAGCGLSDLTATPMDAAIFEVMEDGERAWFEAFDEQPPVSMLVRYDQIYPDVTVTDEALMRQMYDAIAEIRVTAKTDRSKTDGYHCVLFTTADGERFGLSFEHDLLSGADARYELEHAEAFWRLFRQIAEEGCAEETFAAPQANAADK